MTNLSKCSERESLVALVYDDCEAAERHRLEAHLLACVDCAEELDVLRTTHAAMGAWPVPDVNGPIVPRLGPDEQPWRVVQSSGLDPAATAQRRRIFSAKWIQAAAAVLVLGATAALANVEIKYGPDGLVVRTGWQRALDPSVAAEMPATQQTASPWRSDLATLERQLRTEFSARPVVDSPARTLAAASARPGSTVTTADAEMLLRRVRQLIDESQRVQQRELALRINQVWREFDVQRRGDLARIEQGFGRLEGVTGASALQQREVMNYLMRVSQKQ